MSVVLDSNILIDHLNDVPEATAFLDSIEGAALSIVSRIEVLAGFDSETATLAREFLGRLQSVPLSEEVAELAITIRRERHLKLPDAVILATARHLRCPLVTRDRKAFGSESDIVVPYTI